VVKEALFIVALIVAVLITKGAALTFIDKALVAVAPLESVTRKVTL
jgi:hypothetical protein